MSSDHSQIEQWNHLPQEDVVLIKRLLPQLKTQYNFTNARYIYPELSTREYQLTFEEQKDQQSQYVFLATKTLIQPENIKERFDLLQILEITCRQDFGVQKALLFVKEKNQIPKCEDKNKITISICTVTQLGRFDCLKLLCEMLNLQTAIDDIIEWIIVDGSNTEFDTQKLKTQIDWLQTQTKIPIVYVNPRYQSKYKGKDTLPEQVVMQHGSGDQIKFSQSQKPKLGKLRNSYNDVAKGDIIIAMDDDDYYPSNFARYVCDQLVSSPLQIAGCSALYCYDLTVSRAYQSSKQSIEQCNFTPNNCMAYKRKHLEQGNRYDDNAEFTEEVKFIGNNKLLQLDPNKSTLHICHNRNTYNKRSLFFSSDCGQQQSFVNVQLDTYEDNQRASRAVAYYKQVLGVGIDDDNDVVFMCGSSSILWSPEQTDLGGSEQSVIQIASNLVRMGYQVSVYANIPKEIEFNGVRYFNAFRFPHDAKFKNLILWRMPGIYQAALYGIRANKVYLDLHDTHIQDNIIQILQKSLNQSGFQSQFGGYFVKSEFHQEIIDQYMRAALTNEKIGDCPKSLLNGKYMIIPNGVRLDLLNNIDRTLLPRHKLRFCYCSSYDRGLIEILQYVWPKIYQRYPNAELHIYYGSATTPAILLQKLLPLFVQPGVMEHGKRDIQIIIREKLLSNFLLYPYLGDQETDCINLKEAQYLGCIPILIEQGVFKYRNGVKFQGITEMNDDVAKTIVDKIQEIIDNEELNQQIRIQTETTHQCVTWQSVSELWAQHLQLK